MGEHWTPHNTSPKDDMLLYGLTHQFKFKSGSRRAVCLSTASILLVLYRTLGPVQRDQLGWAAGIVATNGSTIRAHIHYIRQALGNSSVMQTGDTYQLTLYGRMKVEQACRDLRASLERSINPPQVRLTVIPA